MIRRTFVLTAAATAAVAQLPELTEAEASDVRQAYPDQPVYFHCLYPSGQRFAGMGCPTFLRWIDGVYKPDPHPHFLALSNGTVAGFQIEAADGTLLLGRGKVDRRYQLLAGEILELQVSLSFDQARQGE